MHFLLSNCNEETCVSVHISKQLVPTSVASLFSSCQRRLTESLQRGRPCIKTSGSQITQEHATHMEYMTNIVLIINPRITQAPLFPYFPQIMKLIMKHVQGYDTANNGHDSKSGNGGGGFIPLGLFDSAWVDCNKCRGGFVFHFESVQCLNH